MEIIQAEYRMQNQVASYAVSYDRTGGVIPSRLFRQICNTMVIWRVGLSPAGKGRVHMNKPDLDKPEKFILLVS